MAFERALRTRRRYRWRRPMVIKPAQNHANQYLPLLPK
jgi:hypothetical protein